MSSSSAHAVPAEAWARFARQATGKHGASRALSPLASRKQWGTVLSLGLLGLGCYFLAQGCVAAGRSMSAFRSIPPGVDPSPQLRMQIETSVLLVGIGHERVDGVVAADDEDGAELARLDVLRTWLSRYINGTATAASPDDIELLPAVEGAALADGRRRLANATYTPTPAPTAAGGFTRLPVLVRVESAKKISGTEAGRMFSGIRRVCGYVANHLDVVTDDLQAIAKAAAADGPGPRDLEGVRVLEMEVPEAYDIVAEMPGVVLKCGDASEDPMCGGLRAAGFFGILAGAMATVAALGVVVVSGCLSSRPEESYDDERVRQAGLQGIGPGATDAARKRARKATKRNRRRGRRGAGDDSEDEDEGPDLADAAWGGNARH